MKADILVGIVFAQFAISITFGITCPAQQPPDNGQSSCSGSTTNHGYTCEITCNSGYVLSSSGTLTCEGTTSPGNWDTAVPSCQRITCSPQQPPTNGQSSCSGSTINHGDKCKITCNSGYVLSSSGTLTCEGTTSPGNWNTAVPSCQRITCSSQQPPDNGQSSCSGSITNHGDTCEIACNVGYVLSSSGTLTCEGTNSHGNWNTAVPTCDLITCSFPSLNINVVSTCTSGTSYNYNHKCSYYCGNSVASDDPSYYKSGNDDITCGGDGSSPTGKWSPNSSPPTCEKIVCPVLPKPTNAQNGCNSLNYGSTCTVTCKTGFYGTKTLTCQSGNQAVGSWSDTVTCQEIVCPVLPKPKNARNGCNSLNYGSTCIVTCKTGFYGTKTLTCQSGNQAVGSWSDTVTCQDILSLDAVLHRIIITVEGDTDLTLNARLTIYTLDNLSEVNINISHTETHLDQRIAKGVTKSQNVSYIIPNVNRMHGGEYTFTVTAKSWNNPFIRNTTVDVTVHVRANISVDHNEVTVGSNTSIENYIICQSFGIPAPTVYWEFGESDVSVSTTSTIYQEDITMILNLSTRKLYVGNATTKDIGIYTCIAENTVGEEKKNVTRSATVLVKVAPRLQSEDSDPTEHKFKREINLTCSYKDMSTPIVLWQFGGNSKLYQTHDLFSPFRISTVTSGTVLKSTLHLYNPLCLGPKYSISCYGKGKFGISYPYEFSINTDAKDIKTSNGKYNVKGVKDTQEDKYCASKLVDEKLNENETYVTCEINDTLSPDNIGIIAPQCKGNELEVTWSTKANILPSIPFRITITSINNSISNNNTGLGNVELKTNDMVGRYTTDRLSQSTTYDISIKHFPDFCIIPPTNSKIATTGIGLPTQVKNASINTEYSTQKCMIHWIWPEDYHLFHIKHFKLEVTAKTKLVSSNGASRSIHRSYVYPVFEASDNLTTSKSAHSKTVYSITLNTTINMKPNKKYNISVKAVTCGGEGLEFMAHGKCESKTSASASVVVPPIAIQSGKANFPCLDVDEENGPVSCVLYVMKKGENFTTTELNQLETQSYVATTQIDATTNIETGKIYLARSVAKSSCKEAAIGDGSQSSCTPTTISSSRTSRRSVTEMLQGYNAGVEKGVMYSIVGIAATPTDGGYVLKASKNPQNFLIEDLSSSASLAALTILIIIPIIAILVYLKIRKKDEPNVLPVHYNASPGQSAPSSPRRANNEEDLEVYEIPLSELEDVYKRKSANNSAILDAEFQILKDNAKEIPLSKSIGLQPHNKSKNRFKNIIPYDSTIVSLDAINQDEQSKYINANYIVSNYCPRRYIAAQGPLQTTLNDFWRMLWKENTNIIVMLTNLVENKKKKCEQYWPEEGKSVTFGDITVKCIRVNMFGCYTVRNFTARNSALGGEHKIAQYHFTVWPDHGVPQHTTSLIQFYNAVMEAHKNEKYKKKIVVHCSAGVGRTGTFIALDHLYCSFTTSNSINIYGGIWNLRKQRCEMVQSAKQYTFIHKMIAEIYTLGETEFEASDLKVKILELERWNNTKNTDHYEIEFSKTSRFLPNSTSKETGKDKSNKDKNRDQEVVPFDHNKVVLTMISTDEKVPYFNASWIQGYGEIKFIATQNPMKKSVNLFWRCVVEYNVNHIVMLSGLIKRDKKICEQYWPNHVQEPVEYGYVTVTMNREETTKNIIEREFLVTTQTEEIYVNHYQYKDCVTDTKETKSATILDLLSAQTFSSSNPPLIHCSDGAGLTGVFCAAGSLIERAKTENKIDVFRVVKDLRDQRPLMVRTSDQYKLCYQIIQLYIASFDIYSNFA